MKYANIWNNMTVMEKLSYIIKAGLEDRITKNIPWNLIQSNDQSKLREVMREVLKI